MATDKLITLEAGVDSWFKILLTLLVLLATMGILAANTPWIIKFASLLVLLLFLGLSRWQAQHRAPICQLQIYSNGTLSLFAKNGEEFPGILESDSWTTRWISVVPAGRFDRWQTQRLIICASRNSDSDYRQLIRILRLGSGTGVGNGILGSG